MAAELAGAVGVKEKPVSVGLGLPKSSEGCVDTGGWTTGLPNGFLGVVLLGEPAAGFDGYSLGRGNMTKVE